MCIMGLEGSLESFFADMQVSDFIKHAIIITLIDTALVWDNEMWTHSHNRNVIPHGSSIYSYHFQYAFPNCPLAEFINLSPKASKG